MIDLPQGKTNPAAFQLVKIPKNAYEVEKIVNKKWRKYRGRATLMYQVKWKNYSADQNTWEPIYHLTNVMDLIEEFELRQEKKQPNHMNQIVKEEQISQSSGHSPLKNDSSPCKKEIQTTPKKEIAKLSYLKEEMNLKDLISNYPTVRIANHIVNSGMVYYEVGLYDSNNILRDRLIVSSEQFPNIDYTPQLIQYLQDYMKDVEKYSSSPIKL